MNATPSGITSAVASYVAPPRHSHNLAPARCAGCGREFVPLRWNQTRCKPHCRQAQRARTSQYAHAAREAKRAAPRRFVGIDGEGVTDELTGDHRYVMLRCGERYLAHDGAHLNFNDVLTFLWGCFEEDYSTETCPIYVGFYLKYDFAQWFRTLPENRARYLFDPDKIALRRRTKLPHLPPFPVLYGGWRFDYLPGKRFVFQPAAQSALTTIDRDGQPSTPWCYINDVGAYFQSSFLKAINPEGNPNPVVSQEEFNLIADGKMRRESAEFDAGMIEYNRLECDVLARLMAQLDEGMRQEALRPNRKQWHGPGQLAQLWLHKIGAPKGEAVREAVPEAVREAARASYYGGWFEIFWHGPVAGTSWGYDINSAYPYVMSRLPCLLHGSWHHSEERSGGRLLTWERKAELGRGWGFVRARVQGKHPIVGGMLHRSPNRTILRPRITEGWFVASELAAAIAAGFVDGVRLFERWQYAPCACPPPLAPIAELYAGRLAVGKASPAGKARKLVYNSCAGKQQQSVGQPAYANPVNASLITSGCRELITRAIASHPTGARDLLMVATDGVVFRTPHTALEMDRERLGAWSEERHENLSLYMPGVYWDDASRARIARGEAPVFKSRGIAARDLAKQIERIDAAWLNFKSWPKMTLDVSFQLVAPKQALARGRWDTCGNVISATRPETWIAGKKPVRVISADPKQKRIAARPGRSTPHNQAKEVGSLPYDGMFGDEMRAFAEAEFGDHPDGPPGELLPEALLDN